MKTKFLLLLGLFLGLFSVSYAQQNTKELLRQHVKQLRAMADSLEQKIDRIPDEATAQIAKTITQNSDKIHQKKIYVDAEGRVFWQVGLPVYMTLASMPDGTDGTRIKAAKQKQMESFSDPMYWEGHGVHYIKHQDAREGREVAFEVWADGILPVSLVELKNAPKSVQDGHLFFGKNLIADIKTADELSGVAQTYYSIDSTEYKNYTEVLPFNENKEYVLAYYGVDKVGNVEKPKSVKFTVDLEAPTTEHKILGDRFGDIFAPTTTIDLIAADRSSGVQITKYRFNEEAWLNYTGTISLQNLKEGDYVFTYYTIDKVQNQEVEKTFSFYLDKTAPTIIPEVVGDQFQNRGRVFISSRTNMRLTATDEKSGVLKVYYVVDGGVERLYTEPFPLIKSEGTHTIKYFAIDRVKNKGEASSSESYQNIYLDLMLPDVSHTFIGAQVSMNDTIYITGKTKINVIAKDNDSGIKKTGYKIDGTRSNPYTEPFELVDEGVHTVEYYALDNVNNRIAKEFTVVVDNQGPEIQISFSMKPIGVIKADDLASETSVYAMGTYLFLAATDDKVGIQKIYYTIDENPEALYTTPLLMREKGIKSIKVRVTDQLGNEKSAEPFSFFIK